MGAQERARGSFPWTLGVPAAAVLARFVPGAFQALSYRRPEILAGQWWRLFTCHLTHGSTSHLLWDIAAFAILGNMASRRLGRGYPAFLAASALAVSLGLLAFLPNLRWYCGLSGVDMALFGYVLLGEWQRSYRSQDWLFLGLNTLFAAGAVGKIAYEVLSHRMVFVHTPGLPPVPAAHLLGLLFGMAALPLLGRLGQPGTGARRCATFCG